jgi:PAS domain S-box-containing protein
MNREKPDHYRELVENAPEAIIVVSNGNLLFANAAAAALVGLPDVRGIAERHVLEFVHPDSRNVVSELIRSLHTECSPASPVEATLVRADGVAREVELMTRPIRYDGVSASVVFVRDVTARKAVERALRRSQELYRQVVESMNEALVVYDEQQRVRFVNSQFCRLFECDADGIIGKGPAGVYDAATARHAEENFEKRRRGIHDRYETELKGLTGPSIFTQVSAAPLRHEGKFVGSLALISDISDRKRAESALLRSERRYQEMVDSSPNFIFSLGQDDRFTAVNRTCRLALGLSEEDIVGRGIAEVGLEPDVAASCARNLEDTRRSGITQVSERKVSFRGAPTRIIRFVFSPMFDEGGEIVGITGLGIDITEKKTSEDATQKLLRAVEQMDDVMFTTDPTGTIAYVNPAFERLYGYSRQEAVGQTPRLLKSGEMGSEEYARFWADLQTRQTVRREFVNRAKDGRLLRMVSSVSPIRDEMGRLTGFTAVQRDVTAQRRAEEESRRLEERFEQVARMEALGTLAGGIAHDFNNILSIILTHMSVVERSQDRPDRIVRAATTIRQAVDRGAALSRQILTFARRAEFKPESVDVSRLILDLGSMISETFPRTVQLTFDLDPDLPLVRSDAGQIHQALLNLCLNARDAMPEGGDMRIEARVLEASEMRAAFRDARPVDYICISVSDTGSGMDEETRRRIFEPFFTTKEKGKGTGLGLAVVYGVVNTHGGFIDVQSVEGQGTTLSLYFPVVLPTDPAASPDAGPVVGGTETLLVIDDEMKLLEIITAELTNHGYRVTPAHDGANAIDACRGGSVVPDAVIMDLGMPGMSAVDLVSALGRILPTVPVIAMTGYVDPEIHASVLAAGVRKIVRKPFAVGEMLCVLREILDSRT